MNEHEQEFQDLIEQLGAERPSAPEPDQAFTAGLLDRLLGQDGQKENGWGIGRLASTAMALAVLALVVLAGWVLSSSRQQAASSISGTETTRPAATLGDFAQQKPSPMETPFFTNWGYSEFVAMKRIIVDANLEVTYRHFMQQREPGNYTSNLLLYWEAQQEPDEPLTAFVHILDEHGQILQEQDDSLVWEATSGNFVRPGFKLYALQSVRVDVPDGRYQIETGIYNQATGERLTTADGRTSIGLGEIHIGSSGPQVDLWPVQASQSARITPDETINFELSVGYEIINFTEGMQAQLRFVNQQWLSDGLGEPYVPEGENVLPLTTTRDILNYSIMLDPQQIKAFTQSNIFVPVIDVFTTNITGQPATIWRTTLLTEMPMMINGVSELFYYQDTNGEIVNTFFTTRWSEEYNLDPAKVHVTFGNNVGLTYSHSIQESPSRHESVHLLRFLWQARQTPTIDQMALAHVLNEQGQLIYQQDQQLVWEIADGQITRVGFNEYMLQSVGLKLPNGHYLIYAGLHDEATGQQMTSLLDEFVVEGRPSASSGATSSQLVRFSQAARTSTEAAMQLEAVINYDFTEVLEGEYEYAVKLHYASPDWQSSTSGRAPIDGLALLPLTEDQGTLTVNINRSPQEMHRIAGTARPVPVTVFGRYELVNGNQQFRPLTTITYEEFPLLLDSIEAITYQVITE